MNATPKLHMQIVGNSKIYFTLLICFYHHIVVLRYMAACACAKQAAWDSRVEICIENCIPEMPLSKQLVQIIGRNKFSIRFESLCWILRVSSRTRMSQNQTQLNLMDCFLEVIDILLCYWFRFHFCFFLSRFSELLWRLAGESSLRPALL